MRSPLIIKEGSAAKDGRNWWRVLTLLFLTTGLIALAVMKTSNHEKLLEEVEVGPIMKPPPPGSVKIKADESSVDNCIKAMGGTPTYDTEICKSVEDFSLLRYPGWGSNVIGVKDRTTTILGRFASTQPDPPAYTQFCSSGTVYFLGCSNPDGSPRCPGYPAGSVLKGDRTPSTPGQPAIGVLDIAESKIREIATSNLDNLLKIRAPTECSPDILQTVLDAAQSQGDQLPIDVTDPAEWAADQYYYSSVDFADLATLARCAGVALPSGQTQEQRQKLWQWAGIAAFQADFWYLYNIPFMYKVMKRGDIIRFMNHPTNTKRGTWAKELDALGVLRPDLGVVAACGYEITKKLDDQPLTLELTTRDKEDECEAAFRLLRVQACQWAQAKLSLATKNVDCDRVPVLDP